MYLAVLLLLFHGDLAPRTFVPKEAPFVNRAACEEWAAQDSRRIERVIEKYEEADRPEQWEIRCVLAPSRQA